MYRSDERNIYSRSVMDDTLVGGNAGGVWEVLRRYRPNKLPGRMGRDQISIHNQIKRCRTS
jgi:hypothetical protein